MGVEEINDKILWVRGGTFPWLYLIQTDLVIFSMTK